jgi:hypothetical protein
MKKKYMVNFEDSTTYRADSKEKCIEKFRVEYPNAKILNIERED